MWAAAESQPEMVETLIRHGARVDVRSFVNNWPRQVSAEPRIQWRPAGGLTALLYAARQGCLACVEHLVKAGADPDLADPKGVTPLIMAITNFNFDVAAWLLEHGAIRTSGIGGVALRSTRWWICTRSRTVGGQIARPWTPLRP
jgi:ankyrin repeat protein